MPDTDYAFSGMLKKNEKAQRKYLVTAVDISDAAFNGGGFNPSSAEWFIVGLGVEDSSIEYNPDTETVTDILGITETTVNKLETEQDLDPMTVRGGSKLAKKLYELLRDMDLSKFSMFNVMQIHAYAADNASGPFPAEVHKNCTLTPQSLGGDSYVDMPININFSNDKVLGTANIWKYSESDNGSGSTAITFTATSSTTSSGTSSKP